MGQTSCTGTFNLDGGQITVQGLADNGAMFGRGETNPLSIIGGNWVTGTRARGLHLRVRTPGRVDQTANFVLDVRSPASAANAF